MLAQDNHSSLSDYLQSLYTWFARYLFHQQRGSYRPVTTKGMRKSVIRQLRQHIKQNPPPGQIRVQVSGRNPEGQIYRPDKSEKTGSAIQDVHGLGHSFHQRHLGGIHHGMAEKLIKSAWEHLHTTIRSTGAGDKSTAKLHLDILDSALQELPHFMEEEEYKALLAEMEAELQRAGPGTTANK